MWPLSGSFQARSPCSPRRHWVKYGSVRAPARQVSRTTVSGPSTFFGVTKIPVRRGQCALVIFPKRGHHARYLCIAGSLLGGAEFNPRLPSVRATLLRRQRLLLVTAGRLPPLVDQVRGLASSWRAVGSSHRTIERTWRSWVQPRQFARQRPGCATVDNRGCPYRGNQAGATPARALRHLSAAMPTPAGGPSPAFCTSR
jgi:hypothetical protein